MGNTFRKIYKKTGNSGTSSDYQLVGNIGVNGIELDIMKGATSGADGQIGLVPKPTSSDVNSILTGSGIWNSLDTIIENSEKYTALKTFINTMPIVRAGTKICKNVSGHNIVEYTLFSSGEIGSILGVSNSNHTNTVVIFMNADRNAGLMNIDYASYYDSDGGGSWGIRIMDNNFISNQADFRVNWIAAYFGKRS